MLGLHRTMNVSEMESMCDLSEVQQISFVLSWSLFVFLPCAALPCTLLLLIGDGETVGEEWRHRPQPSGKTRHKHTHAGPIHTHAHTQSRLIRL